MESVENTPTKTRAGISEIQKKALRAWYFSQEPRPTHAACIDWFQGAYNRRLNQSTVSIILSRRYEHLDHGPASNGHRLHPPQWPLLEQALSEWLEQKQERGEHATGDEICAKAREVWMSIPEYQDREPPQFSAGWLQKFRKRHTTRLSTGNDGVLPAAPLNARREFNGLRTICGEFQDDDVYSMDETGLLWRRAPFDVLSPNEAPAILNKDRARVCLVLCTNSSGSDRVPLWVIGHKETPESLRGVNLYALNVKWRHNQKGWMDVHIMSEWLLSFYERVGTRRVLLLLDNFHAHQAAIESTPPPANVHIQLFPAYNTTVTQPLSLGIAQHVKYHYRKRYLAYIAAGFDTGQSPIRTMSLYHMFCWLTRNWRSDLTNATIYKAFRRSTLIDSQLDYLSAPRLPDMTQLYNTVIQHNQSGRPPLSLEEFADPVAEDWDEQSNEAAWFLPNADASALDEAEVPIPSHELMPSAMAAITGVQTAIRYLLHQAPTTFKDIGDLERIERILNICAMNEQNAQSMRVAQNMHTPQQHPPPPPQTLQAPQIHQAPQIPQAPQTMQAPQTPQAPYFQPAPAITQAQSAPSASMQHLRPVQPMHSMQFKFKIPKTQATMSARNAPAVSSMQGLRPGMHPPAPQNPQNASSVPNAPNVQNASHVTNGQNWQSGQNMQSEQNAPNVQHTPNGQDMESGQMVQSGQNARNARNVQHLQSVGISLSPQNARTSQNLENVQSVEGSENSDSSVPPETWQSPQE